MRYEFKYLVPVKRLAELRTALLPFLEYDKYAAIRQDKEYTVRSIYFDSPKMDAYHEKLDGLKIRKKLRIRGYNELSDDSIVFLEIKRKNEQFVSKNRASVLFNELETLFYTKDVDNYIIKKKDSFEDARRFFFHLNTKYLNPLIIVTYEREAFFSKFNSNTRITFDKNLRTSAFRNYNDLYDENRLKSIIPNHFILEVKFEKSFSISLQKILSRFNLKRMAVSKYIICIDSDPDLHQFTGNKKLLFNNPLWEQKYYHKEAV